jgi:uncharacterized protein YegL
MVHDLERAATSLERLYASGAISEKSADTLSTPRLADVIGRSLGDKSTSAELLLATLLVDDSPSIGGNVGEIRRGHRMMLQALAEQSTQTDVRVLTQLFNRGRISPYQPIDGAPRLSDLNFNTQLLRAGTPLYLQSVVTLGTVLAKAQEEEDRGARVRTFTFIITDGEDNRSGQITARHVHALVTDMLDFSTNHIVAAMGVGERVNFYEVFRAMGIPERWVFSSDTTVEKLLSIFRTIAQSLSLAASSESAFAQLLPGPPSS